MAAVPVGAVPKVFERNGKFSAECYYTDPASGKRRRVVRATGIAVDGAAESRRTAEHRAREIEAELNGARGQARARRSRSKSPTTLAAAFAGAAAASRLAGSPEPTIAADWRSSVHPLRFFGPDSDPWDVDDDALERYALHATKARSPATVLREIASLRKALRAAKVKPMPKAPRIGGVEPRELAFDRGEALRLLAEIRPHHSWPTDRPTRREYVLMYLGLGLSYKELYAIQPSAINWPKHSVRVRGTKRETRDRTVPMSPQVEAVLRRAAELMQARGDGVLFPAWSNVRLNETLSAAAQRAGLVPAGGRCSVNVLRASFCTELVRGNVHPKKIALLMGHKSSKTADRWYARLRGDDDLHDAVATLPSYDAPEPVARRRRKYVTNASGASDEKNAPRTEKAQSR